MANTKTPDPLLRDHRNGEYSLRDLGERFSRALERCLLMASGGQSEMSADYKSTRLVVAFSGGLDSHILLLLASRWCKEQPDASLRSITIDHGLQSSSAQWSQHCHAVCADLQIESQSINIQVELGGGKSPEEAARDARYEALGKALGANESLLTGHHADDQAETLLLQLVRGAGVRGLAGMPRCRPFVNGFHLRPLLDVSREELLTAGKSLGLSWIEDPSNSDERYTRNFVRSSVLPLLRQRWPAIVKSMARSASHCAESAQLNRSAAEDILGPAISEDSLCVDMLRQMPLLQLKNLLRNWIDHHGYRPPSQAQLERVVEDLVIPAMSGRGKISFGGAQLARFNDQIYLAHRGELDDAPAFEYVWESPYSDFTIKETGQRIVLGDINYPDLSSCLADSSSGLIVRSRSGGERLRLAGHRHSKSVKALLREGNYAPWQRSRLPFVYLNGVLIGIVGVGFTAEPAG